MFEVPFAATDPQRKFSRVYSIVVATYLPTYLHVYTCGSRPSKTSSPIKLRQLTTRSVGRSVGPSGIIVLVSIMNRELLLILASASDVATVAAAARPNRTNSGRVDEESSRCALNCDRRFMVTVQHSTL